MSDKPIEVGAEKKAPEKTLSKKGEERKKKLGELRKQRRQAAKRAKQYYCHYCDCFLPSHSERIRREHNLSPKHMDNFESYYGKWIKEKDPGLLEKSLDEVKHSHQLLNTPAPLRINIPVPSTQPTGTGAAALGVRVGSPSIRIGHGLTTTAGGPPSPNSGIGVKPADA